MNPITSNNLIYGVLRDSTGIVTGEIEIPKLAMDSLGGLFFTSTALDSAGDPITVGGSKAITTTNVSVAAVTIEAIAANVNRRSLEFFNNSTTVTIFLGFDVAATVLLFPLLPNAYYTPPSIFQGVVNAIGGAAGPSILVINEGV